MKKVQLTITGIQVRPDGSGTILTKVSNDNPSATGAYKKTAGQMERFANRAGFGNNVLVLKHVAALGAILTAEVTERKVGEAWKNEKTGEEGTYSKDFTDMTNEEIILSPVAQAKVAEIALQQVFAMPLVASAPVAPSAPTANEESNVGDEPA